MENQNHKKIVDAIKAIGADYKSLHEAAENKLRSLKLTS